MSDLFDPPRDASRRSSVARNSTYDELLTVVTEVESVLNSRPLTYVSCNDMEEPLTPAHFLTGRRIRTLPDGPHPQESTDDDARVTSEDLSRRINHLNGLMNQFWKRWKSEYLLELRDHHRYNTGKSDAEPVSKGDVVLVHDDKPRGFWRLARVLETVAGRDGRIRGAVLRVSSPTGRPSTLRRPLQLLYPLEMNSCDSHQPDMNLPAHEPRTDDVADHESPIAEELGEDVTDESDQFSNVSGRPRRAAAVRARETVRNWIAQEESCESDTEVDL